jgi:signal transduction histidine kinase
VREVTGLTKDGKEIPVEVSLAFWREGETQFVAGIVRDVTVRKRTEQQRQAEHEVAQALALASTAETAWPAVLKLLCGILRWDVGSLWLVDVRMRVLRCVGLTAQVEVGSFEHVTKATTFQQGQGFLGRVWAEGRMRWLTDLAQEREDLRVALACQVGFQTALGVPILTRQGVVGVLECFSRERREPEATLEETLEAIARQLGQFLQRKEAEAQFHQAQRMEAVGRLAGGIAHDFNNLLTVIRGYSALMLRHLSPESPLERYVEEIQKASERAAQLTQQLLAFSRRQMLAPRVVNLNEIIRGLSTMLRPLLGETITLVTVLDPALGAVKVDPSQIEQVLLNLAVNARDAMPEGGTLTIETTNVQVDEAMASQHGTLQPGSYVLLAVSDTGHGMDAHVKAHLFEPFFTTKGPGKGTGLGLATVYGIVTQSGGTIWVYSEPGQGTTFKIYFPRVVDLLAEPLHAESKPPELTQGTETILVVEDEGAVLELARESLTQAGYRVLLAQGAPEALAQSAQYPGPIHLLLTDVVLPTMNGQALAEQLLRARPGLKVLYMSGYSDNAIVHQGLLDEGVPFISKPFTPEALTQKVRQVLNAPPHGSA